jgi:hypothetical protein
VPKPRIIGSGEAKRRSVSRTGRPVPKTCPQLFVAATCRRMTWIFNAFGPVCRPYSADPLLLTEVLRRTQQQLDLQALCGRRGELDTGREAIGRCSAVLAQTTKTGRFAGIFLILEPSDGLEPSTPSLPWNDSGNWSQPTATVFAYSSRLRSCSICHRLPPVATAGLHKGSIFVVSCDYAPSRRLRGGRPMTVTAIRKDPPWPRRSETRSRSTSGGGGRR